MEYVQHARGTQSEYNADSARGLVSDDMVCFTTDTRRIYLGSILMSELYSDADALQYPGSTSHEFPNGDIQRYGTII